MYTFFITYMYNDLFFQERVWKQKPCCPKAMIFFRKPLFYCIFLYKQVTAYLFELQTTGLEDYAVLTVHNLSVFIWHNEWYVAAEIGINIISNKENRWKRGMLPKCLLSIKGRSCNQTPLVHHDMTKKTTFYEK